MQDICLFIKSMSEKKHSFATCTGTADDGSAVFSDRWFTDWHLNIWHLCVHRDASSPFNCQKYLGVYLRTCVVYLPVMLRSTEWVQREDECSRQCTVVDKWILLSLLHSWTGTCNVSQSFNSNLPWPVVGYIIINHPCQLVQTNCWVEARNR